MNRGLCHPLPNHLYTLDTMGMRTQPSTYRLLLTRPEIVGTVSSEGVESVVMDRERWRARSICPFEHDKERL